MLGWKELLIILVVAIVIFGTSKLKNAGKDLGEAVKGFKKGMRDDDAPPPADAERRDGTPKEEGRARRGRSGAHGRGMFDVGFSELLIIGVVALLVLGPERLPHAARMAGAFLRRARNQWESVRAELERELEVERVKADLDAAAQGVQAPVRELEQALQETQAELEAKAAPAAPREPPP